MLLLISYLAGMCGIQVPEPGFGQPASCCCDLCLLSISCIKRQFLLTSNRFAAVKVTLLTMLLLFSSPFYDLPHVAEKEQSF